MNADEAAAAPPPSPRQAIAPAIGAINNRAGGSEKHSPADVPVGSAQAAAVEPKTEQSRGAALATVGGMAKANDEVKPVAREDFKSKLKAAIEKATPKPASESEAKSLMKDGAAKANTAMRGQMTTERDAATGPLDAASGTEAAPSDQEAPPETTMAPEPLGKAPAPVSGASVVPAPLPAERLDYSADRGPTDRVMADNDVDQEQIAKSNEPAFAGSQEARASAESHEASAEGTYRKSEATVQGQAQAGATAGLAGGLAGFHGARGTNIESVVGKQTGTKDKNAAERRRITGQINGIKDKTRREVQDILKDLEDQATKIFEAGLSKAEEAYKSAFDDAKGGVGTWLTTWGDDWKQLIEDALATARAEYMRQVDIAIDAVADFVDQKLKAAKDRVAQGRLEVEKLVGSLDSSLREFGAEALQGVSQDFDAMVGEIDERRDKLVDKMVQQYKSSYDRMSTMEKELREANKSLWEKVYDATVGVIKQIIAFKDMLLGILAKAAGVVSMIIKDPIGFLGNLVDGIGLGIKNFATNIETHLKQGLMEWLFGALAEGGIQLPETFDLKGILSLVLQILGLTYTNIRARAVNILGEKVVVAIETGVEIFKKLITEGPGALWEWVQEKVGDLKATIIDQIKSFVITKVITAGITWLISLLNPASAFIKACKMIYDIIVFFIERGSQIMALVNAVVDSMSAIANGNITVAANFVEKALAKSIPVVIGFLASLLGLGGISEKIKEVIESVRKPINAAIDWVINKAVGLLKKVGGALGFGKKDDKQEETNDPKHDAKLAVGLAALDVEEQKYLEDGEIAKEDAVKVAASVRRKYRIFKTLEVVDGGDEWDYEYSASAKKKKKAAKKSSKTKELAKLRTDLKTYMGTPYFKVGPHAGGWVVTNEPDAAKLDATTRSRVNDLGNQFGDHHTGAKRSGLTSNKDWIPDHQPVSEMIEMAQSSRTLKTLMTEVGLRTTRGSQRLYPHSLVSARTQGGFVRGVQQKLEKIEKLKNAKKTK